MIWCRCWEYGWGREGIKPGTEWNRTKVIDVQYECGGRIWEGNGINILADQCTESSSRVLYQPRRREKHTADSIEPHQAYETLQPSTWYLCLVSQTLCLQARGWQCHYCLWAQPWEVDQVKNTIGGAGMNDDIISCQETMMTSFPITWKWTARVCTLTPTVVLINANFWPRVHIHIVHQLHLVPFPSSYKMWWTSLLR